MGRATRFAAAAALAAWALAAWGCYESEAVGGSPDLLGDADADGDADSDADADADADADGDADTDADGDVDTESDTFWDTDTDCPAIPSGAPWGNACEPYGTGDECAEGRVCLAFDAESAYCAAQCCDVGEDDAAFCTDQGSGQEGCLVIAGGDTETGPFYCIIVCDDPSDCPNGTDCREIEGAGVSVCMGFAGPAAD